MKSKNAFFWTIVLLILYFPFAVISYDQDCTDCTRDACTSFAAGKLATVDGYTMSGHTCDGNCDFTIKVVPRTTHEPGDKFRIDYPGAPGGFKHIVRGETQIPQVPE
ncbi:MAG: hypothetical protein KAW19_02060, partial [Candidatus Aminicenantes bacterium]|nr:hypothetical protein [Candidatus Aminicenantes bacterium]